MLTEQAAVWDLPTYTITYQWNNDGSPISLATSKTYVLQPSDVGDTIATAN